MDPDDLTQVLEATWPTLEQRQVGPWLFRTSPGGGKRVNATQATGPVVQAHLDQAEAHMRAAGKELLFQSRVDTELDTILAQNGYSILDETLCYQSPIAPLAEQELPLVTAFPIWPPLQIMRDIWAAGGIGPGRLAIMERADCKKISILGRVDGRAAGVVYVGLHAGYAMIHALEVLPAHRRKGLARSLVIAAAQWGRDNGATDLVLLVTRQNAVANALYQTLGMTAQPGYHYRIKSA
ncbi:MAG: GNAT family N-acetyltransferase [Pseudomonadota bacterium]